MTGEKKWDGLYILASAMKRFVCRAGGAKVPVSMKISLRHLFSFRNCCAWMSRKVPFKDLARRLFSYVSVGSVFYLINRSSSQCLQRAST